MANNKIYEEIIYQINTLLKQGELYPKYINSIIGGKNDYKISQVFNKKKYSTDWIDTLEDCIVALDTIVRNPRKFIVIEEDIVDISLAKSISVESIKHLSQHTNLISSVDKKTGMVLPSKILNTSKEESFEIYENRFIYTLLLKIRDFIDIRLTSIQSALLQSGELGVDIESEFSLDGNKVNYKLQSNANFPFESAIKSKTKGQLTNVERVVRIKSIVSDFLNSPFAKEMRSCALVRPPITRTNVILKDPNFKKALVLWQYIETSEKMDFKVEVATETTELNPALSDKFRGLIFLNTILLQSIAGTREMGDTLENAKKREQLIADEYVTKNIDDYVPDDFPLLKMEIYEIRRIYTRLPASSKALSMTDLSKMNAAVDRVLRQARINKAKEDSITRQKLIQKQLEEEAKAKKLALREQKDAERKKRHEEARKRIEARRLEAERQAELKRLADEAAELERKKAEELKKQEEERIKQEKLQEEELERQRIITEQEEKLTQEYRAVEAAAKELRDKAKSEYDEAVRAFKEEQEALRAEREEFYRQKAELESNEIALKKEREMLDNLAKEHKESEIRINLEKSIVLDNLLKESENYWTEFHKAALELGVNTKLSALNIHERGEMEKLITAEKNSQQLMESIKEAFDDGLMADRAEHFTVLMELARKRRTEEEIDEIISKYEKLRKKRKRANFMRKFKKRGN